MCQTLCMVRWLWLVCYPIDHFSVLGLISFESFNFLVLFSSFDLSLGVQVIHCISFMMFSVIHCWNLRFEETFLSLVIADIRFTTIMTMTTTMWYDYNSWFILLFWSTSGCFNCYLLYRRTYLGFILQDLYLYLHQTWAILWTLTSFFS